MLNVSSEKKGNSAITPGPGGLLLQLMECWKAGLELQAGQLSSSSDHIDWQC